MHVGKTGTTTVEWRSSSGQACTAACPNQAYARVSVGYVTVVEGSARSELQREGEGGVRGQRQGSRVKGRGSRVKGQKSKVKGQGSRVKGQGPGVKGQGSGFWVVGVGF